MFDFSFDLITVIEDALDKACSELNPDEFEKLKADIREIIDSYEKWGWLKHG